MRDKTRQRRARMENSNDSSGTENALPSQDEWVWSIVSEKPSVREIIETDYIVNILYCFRPPVTAVTEEEPELFDAPTSPDITSQRPKWVKTMMYHDVKVYNFV